MKKLIVFVTILMLLVPLSAASAGRPEIFIIDVPGYTDYSCGDFIVRNEWTGVGKVIIDWTALRAVAHYSTPNWYYRIDGLGETYYGPNEWTQVYRLGKGKGIMDLGASIHLAVLGAGSVFLDAGRIYYDNDGNRISYQGNHQYLDLDMERFCAAFEQ
jgi:hypothetical protein